MGELVKMASITVHCVVKNEEKWVWYALNSVIDIAQKVLIFDTGSTDKTVEIIKKIKNKKIISSIWKKRSIAETSLAALQTPFKETRRRLLKLYFPKG